MAIVLLTDEQVRAIGKQIGPLKRETVISWLAELAILNVRARYTVVDLPDIL